MVAEMLSGFPAPPMSEVTEESSVHRGDPVAIKLADGGRCSGTLLDFDPRAGLVTVQADEEQTQVQLEAMKVMHLPRLRRLKLYEGLTNRHGMHIPRGSQRFKILFHDEDELNGETLGFHSDRYGLYLFPVQNETHYICVFIAHGQMLDQQIGPPIGEVLVTAQMATSQQIDQALTTQSETRGQQLGDYLAKKAVVTAADLTDALKKQKEIPAVRLGSILVQQNLITEEQLDLALEEQKQSRDLPLGKLLIKMGILSEADIQQALAHKLGIPFVDLQHFQLDPEIIERVPEDLARKHRVLPLHAHGDRLIVAIPNPLDWQALEAVRFATGKQIDTVMAAESAIAGIIDFAYGSRGLGDLNLDDEADDAQSVADDAAAPDHVVVRLVNKLITGAMSLGASDIHIEPQPDKRPSQVRMRRDGLLLKHAEFPSGMHRAVVSRIKVMANMDIASSMRPQDGKIDFSRFSKIKLELRVATLPTVDGREDVVLRLLARGDPIPLAAMRFAPEVESRINSLIRRPFGMFLVCGPTGSGKTTTLHSVLAELNTTERKIWTAEDPVEITQIGLRQVPIETRKGLDFAAALRAFLRADPDVIMIGEMRDEETAGMAVKASLTGHLLLSTLHTNTAPDSVVRLLEMGIDPFNFADALLGILAQRLVRRLCVKCREVYVPAESELDHLAELFLSDFPDPALIDFAPPEKMQLLGGWVRAAGAQGQLRLYRAKGCGACDQIGYRGRLAVHELLVASRELRALIAQRAPVAAIRAQAMKEGMRTLRQDGILKVLAGETDLEQVKTLSPD